MSDFKLSETGEFEKERDTYVFRRLEHGRDSMKGVECKSTEVWSSLEEKVGDDWIAYQFLGTRDRVENMLDGQWDSIADIPRLAMAHER